MPDQSTSIPGAYRHSTYGICHVLGVSEDTETRALKIVYITELGSRAGKLSHGEPDVFQQRAELLVDYQEPRPQLVGDDSVAPGVYRHFKGNMYHILGTSEDDETHELKVLYIPQYGDHKGKLSQRDLKMFLEHVDRPELRYKGPRFALVESCTFL